MWQKIPDWLFYLVIVVLIYANSNRASEKIIPPSQPPELGPLLPRENPQDERIIVNVDKPKSGIGTAFAIDRKGRWITARHVVDSCNQVGLNVSGHKILKTQTTISKDTDTAILTSNWNRKPLANDLYSERQIGERGFFFGFPQGRPGEVVGSLLARNRMLVRGRYTTEEAVLAWSEISRTKGIFGSLGGLSGAPVMDTDGEVIGVVSAESPRRGRIYTVTPENLRAFITDDNGKPSVLNLETYGLEADKLRRDRRIAQVVCLVN